MHSMNCSIESSCTFILLGLHGGGGGALLTEGLWGQVSTRCDSIGRGGHCALHGTDMWPPRREREVQLPASLGLVLQRLLADVYGMALYRDVHEPVVLQHGLERHRGVQVPNGSHDRTHIHRAPPTRVRENGGRLAPRSTPADIIPNPGHTDVSRPVRTLFRPPHPYNPYAACHAALGDPALPPLLSAG